MTKRNQTGNSYEAACFAFELRTSNLKLTEKNLGKPFLISLPCVYQEDCAVQNVWLMGGLSVLTSVPTTPQPVCLLCATKGRHEVPQLSNKT